MTSVLVVAETYTWFLYRMGEEAARTLRATFASLEGLTLYSATPKHHEAALGVLDRFRGTERDTCARRLAAHELRRTMARTPALRAADFRAQRTHLRYTPFTHIRLPVGLLIVAIRSASPWSCLTVVGSAPSS